MKNIYALAAISRKSVSENTENQENSYKLKG